MKRNSFVFGVLLGLVTPVAAHLLTLFTTWSPLGGGKDIGLYVVAALLNLLFVRYYYRHALENTARGIILVTFVATLVLIFLKNLSVAH